MPGGEGRVDERPNDGVEDGLDPQLRLRGQHLAHDWMEEGGVDKGDADVLNEPLRLLGCEVDVDTQGFQYVGTAGEAGDRAAAVLGHRNPRGSRHQGGGSRNIEGRQTSAGTAGVHEFGSDMGAKQHTVCPHGLGESRQLILCGC